ncbi:hypothetical protein P153DRAFT_394316 [Dothidotthia symphoricarpi CBS 119687]|uniref:Uncharacterized protein n=1 Tax=Dothidotthia symphoricarpi CBS 119687 TaxID=1392245 RepID=A0A6A6ALZ2_9PLEO|nr:uncharacterized protein P153DRAFT_394316 [Dothidotthia symphoricarpi CBS 119687]KAF2132148.1 hypothetical protein P153DRAFT_394316 [Dothidotthia symphoricarpi CBS 119687]
MSYGFGRRDEMGWDDDGMEAPLRLPLLLPLPHPPSALTLSSRSPQALAIANLLPSHEATHNETHDRDAPAPPHPYRTSLQLRQQQLDDYYRAHHARSRASSSSGSAAPSLRRVPNLDRARTIDRARTVDPSQQQQRLVRFAAYDDAPHPALRISRRTASAIRFVLEEALRAPYPFTPDLVEENEPMADLTSGRAANGGARTTGGPVPVTQADRSNIRTPQMIMNDRRQREARQREEQKQRDAVEEDRRRSAERRAHAVAGVAGTPTANTAANTTTDQHVQYPTTGAARPPERALPQSSQPPDAATGAHYGRPRTSSQSQQQPRAASGNQPAQASTGEQRRPPPVQHSRRPSGATSAAASSQAGPSTTALPRPPPPPGTSTTPLRDSTTSNFPHAFERWETLSSHWEGLTSYWIRRLEQNTDEVRREPLAQQMSRQITDLSAAGANLFHAVVELQRLRASSERKFQRWFYEHRQEQERAQESQAQLENTLRVEREARSGDVANMERMLTEKKNAERAVVEMKRELQISKEEARRAWEELGRREQEERDRQFSLREGQPTLVGGVQVVPMAQAVARRGRTQEEEDAYSGAQGSGVDIEQHYSYEDAQSPTDTDPFTESTRHGHRDPDAPSLTQGTYIPSGAGPSSSARSGAPMDVSDLTQVPAPLHLQFSPTNPSHTQAGAQPPTSHPDSFYQQPRSYLHQDQEQDEDELPNLRTEDSQSYVTVTSRDDVTSDGEEEYAIDERGNYVLDDAGHRMTFRSLRSPVSDEYDVQEDRRRELEHLQHYGAGAPQAHPQNQAPQQQNHAQGQNPNPPDYSGDGYGDEWVGMRHHHPTRLSDVPEEDERSRTSPSRASLASRGRLY